ncbi:MAG TPA: SpoIID/LytB domain-containing protein [Candidatus Limnocylindrales bacterium]
MRASVRRARLSAAPLAAALSAAVLLLGLTSSLADASTIEQPICDYTNVRTGAGTTYAIQATLMHTSKVTAVTTVTGGSYSTTSCTGSAITGNRWLRITAINGKSVSSLYGRTYLYGASYLFKAVVSATPTASPKASAPASAPAAPSTPPSTAPSGAPSAVPSAAPSAAPSSAPSAAPSAPPSAPPSVPPSAPPSQPPSPTPTPSPTPIPSSGPWETGPTTLGDVVELYGRGYGHGVGMSQYGAYGRAVAGQSASQIVGHYYPGTSIGTMASTTVRVQVLAGFSATASNPLRIYGRVGSWTIDGIGKTFPADAQVRMTPDGAAASGWHLTVIGADTTTLFSGAAPATAFYIRPASSTSLLQLYSKPTSYDRFRGNLRVIVTSAGTINVVNWVSMEQYLLGVVPVEMSSSWPAAALQAQALAARSYAAVRLHPGSGTFDVYDDTRSQVYFGQLGEKTNGTAAVNATAGQVVTYKGAIANTMYHSSDGGWTENNEDVYTSATGQITAGVVAYLRGSSDRMPDGSSYDKTSPFATWHTTIYTLAQIRSIFAADSRSNVGTLVALDLSRRGVSGRLISVTFIGSTGTIKTVSGSVFVAIFNANTPATDPAMRNTLFDLKPIP